ncbi:MAG: glycosyltransferase family 2 protein [Burkholderiaceae bacterium]
MTRTSESVALSSSTLATTASNADLSQLDRVTVIVVTFESAHCLPTLSRLLKACPHVILVDNGSDDGSASIAQSMLPHAQVIALERNLGFGSANNRALDRVATPFAFLLNPDCEIEVEDLAILVQEAMRFPDAAIVAPQLTNARGEPDLSYRWPSTHWVSRGPGASAPLCVGFVCGAAMLFVMDNMRGADRFDERFFLYYEDDDLCLRIFERQRAIILVPRVTAVHRSRGSVGGRQRLRAEYLRGYHHAQSKLIFAEKHIGPASAKRLRTRTLALALAGWPLRLIAFSPRMLARLSGRIAGLTRWRPHD